HAFRGSRSFAVFWVTLGGSVGVILQNSISSPDSSTFRGIDTTPTFRQRTRGNHEVSRGLGLYRRFGRKGRLPASWIFNLQLAPNLANQRDKVPNAQVH